MEHIQSFDKHINEAKSINIDKVSKSFINASKGYGFGEDSNGLDKMKKCLSSIPNDLLYDFLYTLYRIADKSGSDGFDF